MEIIWTYFIITMLVGSIVIYIFTLPPEIILKYENSACLSCGKFATTVSDNATIDDNQ